VASAFLRPAETAVHQFVRPDLHGEFVAALHQAKFDLCAGHASGIDLLPWNHAMLLAALAISREAAPAELFHSSRSPENARLETLRLRLRPFGDISDGKSIPASMMYAKG